ncbi:MAG TPA: L-rhamnose mutarotase [Chthoniobacterales bacterium]
MSLPVRVDPETCNPIMKEHDMKRYGSVIKVRPESLEAYKKYHAAVWPEVLAMIRRCSIRNYSIYLKDDLLFGYFEYHGADYAADMATMAADPKTQEWWAIMMPMQKPLETRAQGEWWANMEEVFHTD